MVLQPPFGSNGCGCERPCHALYEIITCACAFSLHVYYGRYSTKEKSCSDLLQLFPVPAITDDAAVSETPSRQLATELASDSEELDDPLDVELQPATCGNEHTDSESLLRMIS